MMPLTTGQHVRRIAFYVLLMFVGFVLSWIVLLAKARSGSYDGRVPLVTDVEIHSLQARWGVDLLSVPIIAAVLAIARRGRHEVGDVVIALPLALASAVGMAYFPSAVMGGRIAWPLSSGYLDASGYMDLSLTYAVGIAVVLLVVNRVAARRTSSPGPPGPVPSPRLQNDVNH